MKSTARLLIPFLIACVIPVSASTESASPANDTPASIESGTDMKDGNSVEPDPFRKAIPEIDSLLNTAIGNRTVTGAVVLVGRGDDILLEKAFGTKYPDCSEPMTIDTVFDIASLTKVVATTTAVMSLVEKKRISLDAPLSRYLPAAGKGPRRKITIRQLLTHYSGIAPNIGSPRKKKKRRRRYTPPALTRIYTAGVYSAPGTNFQYSDVGFVLLGKIVERVSRQPLDSYVKKTLLDPLDMNSTCFRPGKSFAGRIAPSEKSGDNCYICGTVQDPIASKLNGIAGDAGLFSNVNDLSKFARMILGGGTLDGKIILKPETVRLMTSPQSPKGKYDIRGFGWDIDSRYSSLKGNFFSRESFGHTGYTGTSIWIDPVIGTYVILLTNRPDLTVNTGILNLRRELSDIVGSAFASPVVEKAN